jgi:phosphoribosylformylglycinamidine synthase
VSLTTELCASTCPAHRWVNVSISPDTPSVLLRGMGGATIGVWAAHGEGQALFPNEAVKQHVLSKGLAPIR